MPDPDDAALPPAPLSSEPPAAEKVGEEADGKAAALKPATNADRSPLLCTDRGLPRQDERASSFAHEPPFRPRRNRAHVCPMPSLLRSEARRVGIVCVGMFRSRGLPLLL